jgi:hypothetical protein
MANGRRSPEPRRKREGPVQQKECTGNAVVKPGKLYAVKCHVNQFLRGPARCWRVGRWSN